VIDSYAQTHGYTVILDVSNSNTPVLYASNSVDITKEIIDMYDKSSPSPAPTTTQAPKPPSSGSSAAAAPAKPATAAPSAAKTQ
jgi:outer membrane protein